MNSPWRGNISGRVALAVVIHLVICTSGFEPFPDTYHQIIAFATPEEPDLLAVCSLINTSLLCMFVNMFIEIVIRTLLVMFRY